MSNSGHATKVPIDRKYLICEFALFGMGVCFNTKKASELCTVNGKKYKFIQ